MTLEQRNRLRMVLAIALSVLCALTLLFRHQLAPLAQELICTQVDNQASDAINEAIAEQLETETISYDQMVLIEKAADGTVSSLQTNVAQINRMKTNVLKRVDARLRNLSQEELSVPIGNVLLPELFSGQGPKIPVRVLAVRTSDAVFRNSFTDAGINQTLHQIYIDIHVVITVMTWSGTVEIAVDSAVLAAQTVIVGTVPTTYFGMEDAQ
ncbi:MAG: sporulation protein YunB [Ruminococcaceae bacterium]|nr:sporulation protein YunB [Oscillospiraceae bacterium]